MWGDTGFNKNLGNVNLQKLTKLILFVGEVWRVGWVSTST